MGPLDKWGNTGDPEMIEHKKKIRFFRPIACDGGKNIMKRETQSI